MMNCNAVDAKFIRSCVLIGWIINSLVVFGFVVVVGGVVIRVTPSVNDDDVDGGDCVNVSTFRLATSSSTQTIYTPTHSHTLTHIHTLSKDKRKREVICVFLHAVESAACHSIRSTFAVFSRNLLLSRFTDYIWASSELKLTGISC